MAPVKAIPKYEQQVISIINLREREACYFSHKKD
jgi:hypothetical protein